MAQKGQSQVIQFILFFMIGFSVFLLIGNVFRDQLDFLAGDITAQQRETTGSYFSSLIVNQIVTCKGCDNINTTTRVQNITAGGLTKVEFRTTETGEKQLVTLSPPLRGEYITNVHNILFPLSVSGSAISGTSRPIKLVYYRLGVLWAE